MMTLYELLDFTSGNLVGSYDTREEALADVRAAYDTHGWTAIQDLGLMVIDREGSQTLTAANADLARLALGRAITGQTKPAVVPSGT